LPERRPALLDVAVDIDVNIDGAQLHGQLSSRVPDATYDLVSLKSMGDMS